MKTCLNDACKAENVESAKFCSKCGFKFNEQTLQQNEPKKVEAPIADIRVEKAADIQVQSPEKKSSKTNKKAPIIALIAVLVLAIAGAVYFLTGQNPIEKLEKAAANNDADAFFEQLVIDEDVYVNKDQYKEYLRSLGLPDLYEQIEKEIKQLKKSDDSTSTILVDGIAVFTIEKKDKEYIVYPVAQEVYLTSDYSQFTIEFAKKTFELKADSEIFLGRFLTGEYEYNVKADLGYMDAQQLHTFAVTAGTDDLNLVTLNFFEVDVYSTYPSATLFIDGKDTEMEISDFLNVSLPTGASYELSAQVVNGGDKYMSETIEVSDDDDVVSFTFEEHEDVLATAISEEVAIDFIESFRVQFEQAVNTINFDLISDYFIEGSQQYKDYKQFIIDHKEFGAYHYNFSANEYKDFTVVDLNKAILTTFETFVYESSDDGNFLYEREKEYTIVYNAGKQNYEIETINILDTKKTKQ